MPDENNPVSQKEAAKLLGVTPRIMESWRFRGIGPKFIRLGRKTVRYRPADLQAWMESKTVEPEKSSRS